MQKSIERLLDEKLLTFSVNLFLVTRVKSAIFLNPDELMNELCFSTSLYPVCKIGKVL